MRKGFDCFTFLVAVASESPKETTLILKNYLYNSSSLASKSPYYSDQNPTYQYPITAVVVVQQEGSKS